MIPDKLTETVIGLEEQTGYSEASKFRKARVFSSIIELVFTSSPSVSISITV